MYQKEDKVVYANVGVCQVMEISELDFMDDQKLYYTLQPLYEKSRVIYTPVEDPRNRVRPMMSKEEAEHFIEKLPTIEPGQYANEKERKEAYHDTILSGNKEKWAAMLHYIYRKEQERAAKGQKISAHYMEEMKGIEKLLLGELATAIDVPLTEIKNYIAQKLN